MNKKNINKENESNIGSRVIRYGKVSGTVAGLAAKIAGERFLGLSIEKEEHANQLLLALGNLKGPLMKVGQILATIPEALPTEYATAFQQLQSNAPPMGWPFVKRRMKTELGPDWLEKFESFDKQAAAAASLGQVHKATTHDGVQIACKLQYPDMKSAIEADLNQLKIIFSIYERYDKAIQTKYIHHELSARLHEELDYELEAKFCEMYAYILKNTAEVHVPKIHKELSTKRLISSDWLEGQKLLNFIEEPLTKRNTIAINMFKAWYVPLYNYGVIHGDPHLGNYSINEDLSLNLLDFGCVRVFPPKFVKGVIDLYHALQNEDKELAVHAFKTWGFKNLSNEQIDVLTIWAEFLYGPILDDSVRPIGELKGEVYGKDIAKNVHKKLRETGGITVPREFVFMDRAALGLGSVFLHLKAEVNWHDLFNEMIEDFDLNKLEHAQKELLLKFNI
jgi:predicted unusual protein kinase regulating ubiquinone biosynthesis (AarF/ABC1/UbiB family)